MRRIHSLTGLGALIVAALVVLSGCPSPTGGSGNGSNGDDDVVFQGEWTFIDGGTETGLVASGGVRDPRPAVASMSGELYAAWNGYDGSGSSAAVRVSRYDGDGATDVWTAIDDGGVSVETAVETQDTVDLEPFGGRLYLAWTERLDNGSQPPANFSRFLRVAVYDPAVPANGWKLVDGGGLNSETTSDAEQLDLVSAGGALYAVWIEDEGALGNPDLFVAEYNGDDDSPQWTEIGAEIQYGSFDSPREPHAIGYEGSLVVAWVQDTDVRAKAYDPDAGSWTSFDGDASLNYDTDTTYADDPRLARLGNELYLFWLESDSSGNNQLRARAYDGADWIFVDGGAASSDLNADPNGEGVFTNPAPLVFAGDLYIGFGEKDSMDLNRVRVAVFNGDSTNPSWTFVDGGQSTGLNPDAAYDAEFPQAIAHDGTVVIAWMQQIGDAVELYGVRVVQGR